MIMSYSIFSEDQNKGFADNSNNKLTENAEHSDREDSSELTDEQKEYANHKLGYPYYSCPNPDVSLESTDCLESKLKSDDVKQDQCNTKETITNEEWYKILLEKRQKLKDTIKKNIPQLWLSIELITSVKCILNIADCTLPLVMILLGAASSLKTVPIEMFRGQPHTYYTDSFSAKAMVSHSTAVKKSELPDIDMLPKIRFNLFLAPELSPVFTKKDDDLVEILGILTRIADGRGFESDSGAHGHRGYTGNYMFTMVGAAIDIPILFTNLRIRYCLLVCRFKQLNSIKIQVLINI